MNVREEAESGTRRRTMADRLIGPTQRVRHDEELLRKQEEQFEAFVAQQAAARPDWAPTSSAAVVHQGLATGFGLSLLAILDPDAARLPHDVVTIPLLGTSPPPILG